MNSNAMWLKTCALVAIAGAAVLSSCSVNPDGPAMSGASHGSITMGSTNMCDYYYKKDAGWMYTFQNVENIYDANSNVVKTLTAPPDYVTTMGYDGTAPNGDSLFRYQIKYRVSTSFAGRDGFDMYYIPSTKSNKTVGAFVDGGANLTSMGMTSMLKRPRPVSTDTILAGIAGRIRTVSNDFTNNGTYVWQIDTLWCTSHGDSVFIWEHPAPGVQIVKERCVFIRDFNVPSLSSSDDAKTTWIYDVINQTATSNATTYCVVQNPDMTVSVPAGTFNHTANIRIKTTEVDDRDFNREYKYYACGIGPVNQVDWWYVTTDGVNFNKQDFTRSLISLTHN